MSAFRFIMPAFNSTRARTQHRPRGTALRRPAILFAFLLGLLAALAFASTAAAVMPVRYVANGGSDSANDCLTSGTPCATITHAVAVANDGDAIEVAAGTYTETVDVNKSLTIRGAQAGVNPNDGSWNDARSNMAAESVIHGPFNLSLLNSITVDGFTFERTASNEGHVLIGAGLPAGAGSASVFDIRNNRFVGTRDTGTTWAGIHTNFLDDNGSPGVQFTAHQNRITILGDASGSGMFINANRPGSDSLGGDTITDNYVADSPDNGINVNRPGGYLTLTGNHLVRDDIFTFKVHNGLIDGNTVIDSPQGSIQVVASSAENSSDVTVTNNTVTNDVTPLDLDYSQIDIRGPLSGTNVVSGNSVTLSGTLSGGSTAIYGVRVRGTNSNGVGNLTVSGNNLQGGNIGGVGDATHPAAAGVFVDTDLLTSALDLHVEHNFINGWVNGVSVYDTSPGADGNLPSGATLKVLDNDLSSNSGLGVRSGAGEITDASGNWWGIHTPAGVASLASAHVDYTPWLHAGTDTGNPGFQGDFSHLHADDSSPQTGATGAMQEGINRTTAAGTLDVAAGTYIESVTIDKALTVIGAGMGNTAADTVMTTGTSGFGAITITASNVNVSYLRIRDYTAGGASEDGFTINGVVSNITLDHFAVTNTASAVAMEYSSGLVQDVTISNCYLHDNRSSGVEVYFPTYVDGLTVDNCDIQNNAAEGIFLYREETGDAAGTNTDVHITNSTVSNNAAPPPDGTDAGEGNITAYGFNGNLEISNVDVDASGADYGIRVTGLYDNPAPAGNISLSDVNITGTPINTGLNFAWYTSFGSFSLHNVTIDVDLSAGLSDGGRPRGALVMRHITNATALGLGNTVISGTRESGAHHPYDIVASGADLNATNVTFTQAGNFAIEDVVFHRLDANPFATSEADPTGLVTWVANNVYVTADSGSIQRGVDAASAGDTVNVAAATFDEHVTVGKRLTIDGKGDTTVINPSDDGPGIVFSAGGTSPNPTLVKDIKVTGVTGTGNNGSGIQITAGSHFEFNNVTSSGNGGNGLAINTASAATVDDLTLDTVDFSSNGEAGFRIPSATSLGSMDGLTVTDSHFDDNTLYGFEINQGTSASGMLTNVSVTNSTFNGNASKGIYAERLDNATFDGITVNASGTAGGFAAGIDINLKKGAYTNLLIKNSSITGSGTGDATNGVGITIKARNDGSNGPTTLTGVNLNHNIITGNQTGIRFGEVTKNNPGPTNVELHRNNISGSVSDNGLVNAAQAGGDAACNWWGAASGPGDPGANRDDVTSTDSQPLFAFTPWLLSSTLTGGCNSIAVNQAAANANGNEGDTLSTSGSFSSDSPVAPAISVPNGTPGNFTDNGDGSWSWSYDTTDNFTTVSITVTAIDENGSKATDSFNTSADNVAPTATISAPNKVHFGLDFALSLTNQNDASSDDVAAGFTYAFDCGGGSLVNNGTTDNVTCTAPGTPGTITVRGKITDKDGGSTTVQKNVQITQQAISLTPVSKDYGTVLVGSHSANSAFHVKNVGTANLTISNVSLGGVNPGHFALNQNNCFSVTLAPSQQCTVYVWFAPTSQGAKSAQLTVESNDPNHASVSSTLTGTGARASNGTITIVLATHPGSHAFTFSGTNGIGTFQLTGASGARQAVFTKPAGTYQITQSASAGWALTGLTCTGGSTTTNAAHRSVLISLTSSDNVTCTFTDTLRKADAQIATALAGPYHGDNVYSATPVASQQANGVVGTGATKNFYVKLQNDSVAIDSFRVSGTWTGSTKYTVTIFRNNIDVTAAVEAGTYNLNNIASGASVTLRVSTHGQAGLPANATGNLDITLRSKTAPAATDLVRAHVTAH